MIPMPPIRPILRRLRAHLRRPLRWLAVVAALLAAVSLVTLAGLVVAVRWVPFDAKSLESPETSSFLFDRNGRPLRAFLGTDEQWRVPVHLDEVSTHVVNAIVAVEDKRFFTHCGVDPIAILRATLSNLRGGRIVSGASTITMQVVGLSASRERTLGRKLRQAFRALQVERVLSKERILELYLTYAPYGGNICGIEAAAQRYFAKSAAALTLDEATLLAGIPQSPARLRPDRFPKAALARRETVLARMRDDGKISPSQYDRARARTPRVGSHDAPVLAPHFTDLVHDTYPRMTRIRTTLDLEVQQRAEALVADAVRAQSGFGVTNGAAVVLHNQTGEVLAMVGSADYNAIAIQGQVNGATSSRSPGSALKPLLYALAFSEGAALTETRLLDVPTYYGGYHPENFDHACQGLVSADKAMAWSLNIPAIELLQETGLTRAVNFMRSAGLATLDKSAGEYGLSLALGTCGVTLLDLAGAYAMLARGGDVVAPKLLIEGTRISRPDKPRPMNDAITLRSASTGSSRRRLLSPQAAGFALRALADPTLRPPEEVALSLKEMEGIAWKTGTSSGFRDAWTIACTRTHTTAVWLGNFDGRPSPGVTGARAAAPVALSMAMWLQRHREARDRLWPPLPDGTTRITVCALTGAPASLDCPTTRTALAIPDTPRFPVPCRVHQRMSIDTASGEVLCPRCAEGRTAREDVFAVWPARVSQWFRDHQMEENAPPRHFAGCATRSGLVAPRIVSPSNGDAFLVQPGRPPEAQKIALRAVAPAAGLRLYWFLDGKLIHAVAPGTDAFLILQPGSHRLRCADDLGRADEVAFNVTEE